MSESIAEWFRSKNVFITGATGFMGKVLIYKLLMSCPDLGNVFVLIREKKGADPRSRLHALIQEKPFAILREKHGERLKKIVPVVGETTLDGLGLAPSDKERLMKEVSVVFHVAANVRFDLSLKEAVKTNVEGTVNVVALAKQMVGLDAFIHVSTTYCQCSEPILEERAYPVSISPESIMMTVNRMRDDVLEAMTPQILGAQPNTYAFSKALGEDVIEKSGLPAGVLRPSIVVASLKEPLVGWVDNMHGPTGLMIGAGKGVIRTMLCEHRCNIDVIPCDIAINAAIALAWKVGREKPEKAIFLNATNSSTNPITWGEAIKAGRKHALSNPFSGLLWYPGGGITTSKLYHYLRLILFHYLPAYFLDGVLLLTGNKPFMIRVQSKVSTGFDLLQYYTMKQWIFRNDRIQQLEKELSPADRETFYLDTSQIDWDKFILHYILGARQYCLKDDLSTLPQARKVIAYYWLADVLLKTAFFLFIAWTVYSWITGTVSAL